jgi:hypothetical protein
MNKYKLGDYTITNWNSWDRVPRDPVTVGAYILASVGATTLAASTVASFVVGYLVTTAVTSWALNALAPKPNFGAAGSASILVNTRDAAAPQDFVYGEIRKGGAVTYYETTGDENKFLHQIICLAGHELNSIGDIYINDVVATIDGNGYVTTVGSGGDAFDYESKIFIRKFTGASGQNVKSSLDGISGFNGPTLPSNFRGDGIACLYVRYEYDQDKFLNGVPLITAKVQGKKVFDPRISSTAYSNNAALCIRDFLRSSYGLSDTGIDNVTFSAAANECDENINLDGGGTEKRYTINGVIQANRSTGDVLQDLVTACAGTLFWGAGSWKLKVGAYSSPVKTLTLDDLRGPIVMDTRITMRDNFNAVSGTFIDADQDYITVDYPQITSAAFKAEDDDEEVSLDLPLPYTTSASTAQRLAKLTLFRGREQMTLSADFGLEAMEVEVGDNIAFTNERYGFDEKEFEVVGWRLAANQDAGDLRITLTLRETSEAAFDWNAEEDAIISNNSKLPAYNTGTEILNLTLADGGSEVQGDGTVINSFIVSWDVPDNAFVTAYDIEWGQTSSANRTRVTTTSNSIVLTPVLDDVEYIVRVRSVSVNGFRGPFASVIGNVGGDTTAPAVPTNLVATGGYQYVTLEWDNPPEADFKYAEVYEATTDDINAASFVGYGVGTFTRFNLPNDERRYYFVRSVDYSGNTSAFTSSVNAITGFLENEDFVEGIYAIFKEQGLYAIEDVTTLPASGAFVGEKVFNRTDGKLYQWDGSSWDLVIADVADNSITASDKIIANTITGGLLQSSGIITNSAQIENATITTLAIQGQAVTIPTSAYTSGNISLGGSGNNYTVQTVNFQSTGAPVFIDMSFAYQNGSVGSGFDVSLRRGSTTVYSSGNRDAFSSNKGAWSASFKDTPSFGSVTYTIRVTTTQNCSGTVINQRSLMALEVKR